MNVRHNRREFLKRATAAGTGLVILTDSRTARSYQANEKLNLALIGVGGRGTWFVNTMPSMESVVALCDVDQRKIEGAFQQWTEDAKRYADSAHAWERNRAAEYKLLVEIKCSLGDIIQHQFWILGLVNGREQYAATHAFHGQNRFDGAGSPHGVTEHGFIRCHRGQPMTEHRTQGLVFHPVADFGGSGMGIYRGDIMQ